MAVDPYFAALIEPFRSTAGDETAGDGTAALVERFWTVPDAYVPPTVATRDETVAGPHGPVRVRVYAPPGDSPVRAQGALVWVHGGGFTSGSIDAAEADAPARALCAKAGLVVVSAGYHLAGPKRRFPVPHHDVLAAWRWVRERVGEWGVAEERLAIGGASAGANLVTGVTLHLREAGEPAPAALALVYPTLHAEAQPQSPELAAKAAELPLALRCPPESVRAMTEAYLGPDAAGVPAHAMPGHADAGALAGLPPTLLISSEYDDLRVSAEVFQRALLEAGVDTYALMEPGALHGFLAHPLSPAFGRTIETMVEYLRRL
jgi:acetyl esterase